MFRRTETMTIKEFLNPEPKPKIDKKKVTAMVTSAIPLAMVNRIPVYAAGPEAIPANAVGDAIREKIIHAFDPVIEMLIALSYPVAGVMISAGSLMVMIGSRDKGLSMINLAGLGYILVQLSPLLMDLLVQVGNAI